MRGGYIRAGRFEARQASLVDLIVLAWSLSGSEKVVGGPGWLDTDRFDIVAKAPADTTQENAKLMLRGLLASRFGLKAATDKRAIPVFTLTAGKGKPKLKETSNSEAPGACQSQRQDAAPESVPQILTKCHNRTMEQFANDLRDTAGGYLPNPVVDQTGLKGGWDFEIRWTPRGQLARAGADGISIFDAVEKQLGLKLQADKAPIDVIAVETVARDPSPDSDGISAKLPPRPPAEFEVATLKPSDPNATNTRGRLEHGRVTAENVPLSMMVRLAWDINADELMANMPKFADSTHFDLTAKAPPPPPGVEVDEDDLRMMIRGLLADRFALKVHTEERPVEGYVLTAAKPKMRKADPANRTGCKEGPGPDGKDPRLTTPILSRLVTCQNMTMAEFARQLPNLANGYAHVDVLDATGLTDAYDFTLSFSAVGLLRNGATNGPAQPPGSNSADASDPSGGISLPDAVARQLGLKLELKKRPMQVLIIDHLDEKPSEN
jgi:uncharacterized protein (TIGR03435 family)